MKYNIAIVDPSSRISGIIISSGTEPDSSIHGFSSAGDFAEAINHKMHVVDDLAMVIICIVHSSINHHAFKSAASLAVQLKRHSLLSAVPVIVIGPDKEEIKKPFTGLCEIYIPLPVKKSDLIDAVSSRLGKKALAVVSAVSETFTVNKSDAAGITISTEKPAQKKSESAGTTSRKKTSSPRKKKSSSTATKQKESERRMATVMFADISGFTAISEKMDPEEVTRLMNLCFKSLGSCIERHGGYIDKFIGDCIMAVFGVPVALENAPLQAVNTAIDLRNTIGTFSRENNFQVPLGIHIGINTGMVLSGVVGSDRKMEYTVMGDTVNLASRLEDASDRGQILAGSETYRATKHRFEYRELKPMTLKGKSEPVPVYEVLSTGEAETSRIVNDQIYDKTSSDRLIFSELVGRNDEMNRLRLQVMKVINGEGSVVNIIGEAGIGKSRLVSELFAEPFMNEVVKLEGRAISIGRNLSYYPVIGLLKKMAGINENDSQHDSLVKLEKSITATHPASADEIIPFIATLMGISLTGRFADRIKGIEGEALENLIRKNVRELLRRSSVLKPLVIYMEDLHWADTSTIDLLESVFNLVKVNRILIINVFRPGYNETGERIRTTLSNEFSGNYTELNLEPLDEKESSSLISKLLKIRGLSALLKGQVTERSGGNPFFIEEVVRSLIDDGSIIIKKGRFKKTDRIHNFSIPLTINELLMSRIDRLDEDTKDLVKIASVIGRNFFRKIILQVAADIPGIDARLNYLEDIQMIRERSRLDEIEYMFKHALIQETVYESLLFQKRRDLHLQVAYAIENTFNERLQDFYGMLAYHYSMGENLDRAEEYMLKAGDEALKSSASSEAVIYYKKALDLYSIQNPSGIDNKKIITLYCCIASALYNNGLFVESIDIYNKILEHFGYKKNSSFFIYICTAWGLINFLTAIYVPVLKWKKIPDDRHKEVFNLCVSRARASTTCDPKNFFIETITMLRWIVNYKIQEFNNGNEVLASTSVIFTWTGISEKISMKILNFSGKFIEQKFSREYNMYRLSLQVHNVVWGYWDKISVDQLLVDHWIKSGELFWMTTYLAWTIHVYTIKGDGANSLKYINTLGKIGTDYNNSNTIGMRHYINIEYLYKYRYLDEFDKEVNENINFCEKINFQAGLCVIKSLLAGSLLLKNEKDKAQEILDEIKSFINEIKSIPFYYSFYLISRAQLEIYHLERIDNVNKKNKQFNLAVRACKKAVSKTNKVKLYYTESLCLLGNCYWAAGKHKKALKWWGRAVTEGEKLGARLDLARTFFEAGRRLLPSESIPDSSVIKKLGITADLCIDRAELMFSEMDLKYDLEQLKEFRLNTH